MSSGKRRMRYGGQGHHADMTTVADGSPDDIVASVAELLPTPSTADQEAASRAMLLHLHESYVNRYLKDNDRTWSTAPWLIGLSWALFPAAITMREPGHRGVYYVFALTSIALSTLWYYIAEWHRVWASRSFVVVRAIERKLLPVGTEASLRSLLYSSFGPKFVLGKKGHPMRGARLVVLFGTPLAWGALVVVDAAGWVSFRVSG